MSQSHLAPTYKSGTKSVTPSGTEASTESRGGAVHFLGSLASELSGGAVDLPCFPDVVIRIRKALDDPKIKPEQAVTIVGAEPRLAAKLLQTASSAAFNPSGRPLTDLRAAITRLGHQLVQSAAMAFAVQQMQEEKSLRTVAAALSALWNESVAVASIAQVVARRTKITPDEAFLTGLLHGIGRLYILVRSVGQSEQYGHDPAFLELVGGWHASIGKAVLENWGFAQEIADAVGDQSDFERKKRNTAELTDILMVSMVLGEALQKPAPREIDMDGVNAFQTIGLSASDCANILKHAEYALGSLHETLGC
jgi:HD-like signal output (HDOD) protein